MEAPKGMILTVTAAAWPARPMSPRAVMAASLTILTTIFVYVCVWRYDGMCVGVLGKLSRGRGGLAEEVELFERYVYRFGRDEVEAASLYLYNRKVCTAKRNRAGSD